MPVGGRGAEQGRGAVATALAARKPLVELERARLLELVDHRVGIRAETERRARVGQPASRADAVGEVALGRRAETAPAAVRAEQRDVRGAEVGRVHGGERCLQGARVGEHPGRRPPVGVLACLVLGRLLGDVRVQRAVAIGGPAGDRRGRAGVDGADAVDRRTDPHAGPVSEHLDALRPGVGIAVRKAPLDFVQGSADPPVQVAACRAA